MNGSLTLRDFPGDMVRLTCDNCGRKGQYRKGGLVARYGADIPLPDLLVEIAECDRRGNMNDPCAVHYEGLTG